MIRAIRALTLAAAFAVALTPVTCLGQGTKPLPAKATQELPPELLALLDRKKMPKYSPIVMRIFKEEAELEVWKQDTAGRFQILKTYPICRWSGDLGPKLYEGDRQAPEGFYTVTPELMNPNSSYHLAINLGTAAGLLICVVVALTFISAFVRPPLGSVVALCWITAMALVFGALLFFLLETRLATKSTEDTRRLSRKLATREKDAAPDEPPADHG